MLPAQVWTQQARLTTTFESTITYPCGAIIDIKTLARLLVPLAQSNPADLPGVAEIVRRRDHLQMSLALYEECDSHRNGYLEWEGGQLYNFVVSVFRHNGFLPPFSGQVKEVAERFLPTGKCVVELMEARECLCVVDALMQALTFEARSKISSAESPVEKEVVRKLDNELARSSNTKTDQQLEGLIDRIETGLGKHTQLLTSVAEHWSPAKGASLAAAISPSLSHSRAGMGSSGMHSESSGNSPLDLPGQVPSSTARFGGISGISFALDLPAKVPSPQEVRSLVDKAQSVLSSIGKPPRDVGTSVALDLRDKLPSTQEVQTLVERTSATPLRFEHLAISRTPQEIICPSAEKVCGKPLQTWKAQSSAIPEELQASVVAGGSDLDKNRQLTSTDAVSSVQQGDNITHQIVRFQERILALDKEIEDRDNKIQKLQASHEAELRQLNEELKDAKNENNSLHEMVLVRDQEIKSLQEKCGMGKGEDIQKEIERQTEALNKTHEAKILSLQATCRQKDEEQKSQRDYIMALKKDKAHLTGLIDSIRKDAHDEREHLREILMQHEIPF